MNIFTKYKKLFLLIAFLLITFILGYLIYFILLKPSLPTTITNKTKESTQIGNLPIAKKGEKIIISDDELNKKKINYPETKANPIARGGLTKTEKLNDSPSIGVNLSPDGSSLRYYNKNDGKFYKIDKNGNTILLTEKIFHNVEKITWSPNKNKAILEYPDGANIIYNFDTKKQITLPKHFKEFNFSPNGDKIVMKTMGLDPANRWLAIANDDGSKIKKIESLGLKDETVYPMWSPNNQIITMYTEGIDFNRQEVYFVGLNNENFKSTVIEGRGFQPKWSPKGDRLLYSVYSSDNNMKPNLWVVNAEGDKIGSGRKNLRLETWANKCAYGDEINLYCAVPNELQEGAGLFPEMAKMTIDKLYKIDTRTGMKKLIAIPDNDYNISNIIISDDEQYLYFTDEATNRIHKIKLK